MVFTGCANAEARSTDRVSCIDRSMKSQTRRSNRSTGSKFCNSRVCELL
jgi:hypothetical protein